MRGCIFLLLLVSLSHAFAGDAPDPAADPDNVRALLNFSAEELLAQYKLRPGDRIAEALKSPQHREKAYELLLREFQQADKADDRARLLSALTSIFPDDLQGLVIAAVSDSSAQVRVAAVAGLAVNNDVS